MSFQNIRTRRDFLRLSAAAGSGTLFGCGSGETGASPEGEPGQAFTKALGAQLYTLRDVMPEKPKETLQALAAIGYQEVELLPGTLNELAPILGETGLKPVSTHVNTPLATGNWGAWKDFLAERGAAAPDPKRESWEAAVEQAKEGGLKYMVVPYLAPGERGDLDAYRKLAEQLNRAGETCQKAGIRLCYHNHAFEFEPMGESTPLETLLAGTDKNLLGIELDVFWTSVTGHDPAALLRKHPGRMPLVHLKDKAADTPTQFREDVPRESFKEVGSGTLDFPAILRAAAESGVEHYFVEQDQCPGDPLVSLRQSYEYLRSVRL